MNVIDQPDDTARRRLAELWNLHPGHVFYEDERHLADEFQWLCDRLGVKVEWEHWDLKEWWVGLKKGRCERESD